MSSGEDLAVMPGAEGRQTVRSEQREVLTFVLRMLLDSEQPNPGVWVDLGCGKGDVLSVVQDGLAEPLRKRLRYIGCDKPRAEAGAANPDLGEARRRLSECGLDAGSRCIEHDLADYQGYAASLGRGCAHLVTLTNVLHEIRPADLPTVLLGSLEVLREDGHLVIYDMERLPPPHLWNEWSAVTWEWIDILPVLEGLYTALGSDHSPAVCAWTQTQTTGWTAVVPRWHLELPDEEARPTVLGRIQCVVDQASQASLSRRRRAVQKLAEGLGNLAGMSEREARDLTKELVTGFPHHVRECLALGRQMAQTEEEPAFEVSLRM